jgi:hypothetical protein
MPKLLIARAAAPMFSGFRERTSTTRSWSNHGLTISDAGEFSSAASLDGTMKLQGRL